MARNDGRCNCPTTVIPAKRRPCGERAGIPLSFVDLRGIARKRGSKSPAIGRAFGMTGLFYSQTAVRSFPWTAKPCLNKFSVDHLLNQKIIGENSDVEVVYPGSEYVQPVAVSCEGDAHASVDVDN